MKSSPTLDIKYSTDQKKVGNRLIDSIQRGMNQDTVSKSNIREQTREVRGSLTAT